MGWKPILAGLATGDSFQDSVKQAVGSKTDAEKAKEKMLKDAAEQKAAQEQAAAQQRAQQWANRPAMKKGGAVKSKRYDAGGSVYTEKMGKPPQDVDGASVRKQSKRDQPEQLGEGIKVDKKAKGGMTASSRADGCCTKGKTKGKMY